jgi:hypothetical protein
MAGFEVGPVTDNSPRKRLTVLLFSRSRVMLSSQRL